MDYLLIKKLACVFVVTVTIIVLLLRTPKEAEVSQPFWGLTAEFIVIIVVVGMMKFGFFLIEKFIT